MIPGHTDPADPGLAEAGDGGALEPLLRALLSGDRQECDRQARSLVGEPWDIERFYLMVIEPVMRRIGHLWETQRITAGQEHVASSLVTRMMTSAYTRLEAGTRPDRRALVAVGPGEQHQIGAWMLADLLELQGWDTRFLGAGTTTPELLDQVASFGPQILALSLTQPTGIRKGGELIRAVRALPAAAGLRIMVGGRAFLQFPDLVAILGADGFAEDARGACRLAEDWFGGPRA